MKLPLLIASGIGLCLCLYSCEPENPVATLATSGNKAYVPVYMTETEKNNISLSSARTTKKSGKIYAYGNYIFQNDQNKGIHIIDNTDRLHPEKVAFLNIPYNTEFAVKGNFIYANNVNDLVVIDIRDVNNPTVVKRLEGAFPYVNQQYPRETGYFECPDPAKGIVVAWELQTGKTANCRR